MSHGSALNGQFPAGPEKGSGRNQACEGQVCSSGECAPKYTPRVSDSLVFTSKWKNTFLNQPWWFSLPPLSLHLGKSPCDNYCLRTASSYCPGQKDGRQGTHIFASRNKVVLKFAQIVKSYRTNPCHIGMFLLKCKTPGKKKKKRVSRNSLHTNSYFSTHSSHSWPPSTTLPQLPHSLWNHFHLY